MNYWKQLTHVMSYFPEESFRGNERLPNTFMKGFLEVRSSILLVFDNITTQCDSILMHCTIQGRN